MLRNVSEEYLAVMAAALSTTRSALISELPFPPATFRGKGWKKKKGQARLAAERLLLAHAGLPRPGL
ncbi:MAG: hypothetical protein ACPIOQ_64140, partial [Promethearchaeia archaeon]